VGADSASELRVAEDCSESCRGIGRAEQGP